MASHSLYAPKVVCREEYLRELQRSLEHADRHQAAFAYVSGTWQSCGAHLFNTFADGVCLLPAVCLVVHLAVLLDHGVAPRLRLLLSILVSDHRNDIPNGLGGCTVSCPFRHPLARVCRKVASHVEEDECMESPPFPPRSRDSLGEACSSSTQRILANTKTAAE
jgi:hypothetical protein